MTHELPEHDQRPLHSNRKHSFTKKHIDHVAYYKAVMSQPVVELSKLTDEDIGPYKKISKGKQRMQKIPQKRKQNEKKRNCKRVEQENENTPREDEAENTEVEISNDTSGVLTDLIGKIKVRDIRTMVDESTIKWMNFVTTSSSEKNDKSAANRLVPEISGTLSLPRIKNLYKKYFTKYVHDTVIIIACILRVISVCSNDFKKPTNGALINTSKPKRNNMYNVYDIKKRHKTDLEKILKKKFIEIVLFFDASEFDCVFQIFFLSILSVFKSTSPRAHFGFDYACFLLHNCLEKCRNSVQLYAVQSKIYATLKSQTFRLNCHAFYTLLENSRGDDPEITDCMSLFFMSKVNNMKYFLTVVYAIVNASEDNIEVLIYKAIIECYTNSCPEDSPPSTAKQSRILDRQEDQQSLTAYRCEQNYQISKGKQRMQKIPQKRKQNEKNRNCKRVKRENENTPREDEAENTEVEISNDTSGVLTDLIGKIKVRDIRTMVDESTIKWMNFVTTSSSEKNEKSAANRLVPEISGTLSLPTIKNSYKKPIDKSIADQIEPPRRTLNPRRPT